MAKLTAEEKKILKSMFIRSGTCSATFNMVKMEANAYTIMMAPAINDLYKDDEEERLAALARANNFFNTHNAFMPLIGGIDYAMSKKIKESGSKDYSAVQDIKIALMGPTAGIGDSFFYNCVRVIAAGIGIGLAEQGNALGPIIFTIIYLGAAEVTRWFGLVLGYTAGGDFIDKVFENGMIQVITKAASILGLGMVGAMVAQMVNIPIVWQINVGGTAVDVNGVLDSVMPGLLSIILVFFLMKQLQKGKRPTTLILLVFIASLLFAFLGIF